MSNALTPQQLVPTPPVTAGLLEVDEIQGDVLIGLQKFVERFIFFKIVDIVAFRQLLRDRILARVTTTRTVQQREFELAALKKEGTRVRIPLVGLNVGFTSRGIGRLVPGANLGDPSFAAGAKRAADPNPIDDPSGGGNLPINDPVDAQGNLSTWKTEFLAGDLDGVFLITGGTQAAVDAEATVVLALLGTSVQVSFDQTGNVRPGLEKGHEHFGWLDGVSQPAVAGLSTPFPGQAVLTPGLFVFGYADSPPLKLPWMKNGSFMAFRRLNQLVPEFDQFVGAAASKLQMDPVLLGARMVGRWKSGAPLALTPVQDDNMLGADANQNNHFDFSDDQAQRRCPFSAHIRKTNPRADLADFPPDVLNARRIIRAGIPFGPEVDPVAEKKQTAPGVERGLLFVCYQTSLLRQFEFLQGSWANSPDFISPEVQKLRPNGNTVKVGIDPIIGQAKPPAVARTSDEPIPNYPTGNDESTLELPQAFVVPTGGVYFFMPSISAMKNELSATQPASIGQWSSVINLANVPIHTQLLPTGKVLFWGRRKQPTDNSFASLNEWETHAFVLDLETLECKATSNQPVAKDGKPINLFCSGHTFLPDGRLMVVGGHLFDGQGINCATIYDPATDTWTAADPMQGQIKTDAADSLWKNGRWYPTAITLADGSVLVCSGSFANGPPMPQPHAPDTTNNRTPEIWDRKPWIQLTPFGEGEEDLQHFLFPRLHLAPDGRVFMSGAGGDSFFFDTTGTGKWLKSDRRQAGDREYAPAVMYDVGKIVFIGGGNDDGTHLPSNIVEAIDLTQNPPRWQVMAPMHFRRRQHNATLLPDGTVLVTGGTAGAAGLGGMGFDDLTPGATVHAAELWDPRTNTWTVLAEELIDRCYHSTAVLLPDGRVLSGGGGEYQPTGALAANDRADTHLDAQIFSPPYLFKKNDPRPQIQVAPDAISYGQTFKVATPDAAEIGNASLVRLSSVTHSFNPNQRVNFLTPTADAGFVTLTAPATANVCPPGHYLLFLISKAGVPSIGKIVKVEGQPPPPARLSVVVVDEITRDKTIIAGATRPEVVVGLTPTCTYGLGICLAGATTALLRMGGVAVVRPIADNEASVAFLYLDHDGLPDIESWPKKFAASTGSYGWRGVEVTLTGTVQRDGDQLILPANQHRPTVTLAPLQAESKIQWDRLKGIRQPRSQEEKAAYADLAQKTQDAPGPMQVKVTGPLKKTDAGFVLEVRKFE